MSDILVQIIFGWPAILFAIALALIGMLAQKPLMVVAGGLISIPFAWYLSGYPSIRITSFLLPVFQIFAAWAMHTRRKKLAWLLMLPVVLMVVGLAVVVIAGTAG